MGVTSKQRGRQIFASGIEIGSREYDANGAIAPTAHTAYIMKAGVGGYTLAAPARSNQRLTIVSRTANAHVVTATGLVDDGVTGGSKNTLTFAAFAGAAIELLSYGSKWNVISVKAVTVG